MGIFRSEDMYLYKFGMAKDHAWEVINYLGAIDCVHIIDMNVNEISFNLPYAEVVNRCNDLER